MDNRESVRPILKHTEVRGRHTKRMFASLPE